MNTEWDFMYMGLTGFMTLKKGAQLPPYLYKKIKHDIGHAKKNGDAIYFADFDRWCAKNMLELLQKVTPYIECAELLFADRFDASPMKVVYLNGKWEVRKGQIIYENESPERMFINLSEGRKLIAELGVPEYKDYWFSIEDQYGNTVRQIGNIGPAYEENASENTPILHDDAVLVELVTKFEEFTAELEPIYRVEQFTIPVNDCPPYKPEYYVKSPTGEKWNFDDIYISEKPLDENITLYVSVPTSFHNISENYPDAETATISVVFQKKHPESEFATIKISPTKEINNVLEDYDWKDIKLEKWIVDGLILGYIGNKWPRWND